MATNPASDALLWALKNNAVPLAPMGRPSSTEAQAATSAETQSDVGAGHKTLWLRAIANTELLAAWCAWTQLPVTVHAVQSFAPEFHALENTPLQRFESIEALPAKEHYGAAMVLPPRARAESRALIALAYQRLSSEGFLLASMANQEGAGALESDIEALFGSVQSVSKHKARVLMVRKTESGNAALAQKWLEADQAQIVTEGIWTRPGVFAWDRIDPASDLLRTFLQTSHDKALQQAETAADLGCGHGVLARALISYAPKLRVLDLFEAEKRALDLTRLNVCREHLQIERHWQDVRLGIPAARYDLILSNPPFHQGRVDVPDLGLAFIRSAHQGLKIGGVFYLVANQHLPYEALLRQLFKHGDCVLQRQGFKIYRLQK